ncbi:glycosyl transferase family 2 [Thermotomaculum hydrothermale]|uniref:Glycosyl transferase family 2 n=1 Tax=Thermotomaculum hydrothermale TaxID=981385 RepID=A0A7R6SYJ7_9BACT|nr:glycosyltransferase [Thermotomaculum hydrothermale]BBB31920.1 glycosyl transferase family 2 [Thermotomaculum hydrothermale]
MISFIMMAKNVENYIADAIISLQKENKVEWELIVIDDHSEDKTFEIAQNFAQNDKRIRIYKNKYRGKVLGTNYGFSLSKGDIIKCIDSDDVLLPDFFNFYKEMKNYDAHCHSAYIVDSNLKKLHLYNVNPLLLQKDYSFVLENLVSIPKWSWSFKREIAEKIFPMPESIPFEDVWMSLSIKKNAGGILFIEKPLYLYRQHGNQTFGGIANFSKDVVIFRANRLLRLIEELKKEERIINGFSPDIFNKAILFNKLMAKEKISFAEVLKASLPLSLKLKILLIKKFPLLARYAIVLKWKIDKLVLKK